MTTAARELYDALRQRGIEAPIHGCTLFQAGAAMLGLRIRANCVQISDLWVSPTLRGQGQARALLRDTVLPLADQFGVPLRLRVCAFDRRGGTGMTDPQLRRWYESLGFASTRGTWMRRQPRAAS